VYSEPGDGTTIKLYFPRSAADEVEVPSDMVIAQVPTGQGEHIFVVEDDLHVRQNVVAMVTRLGYRVTVAGNSAEALEVLEGGDDIGLLFTDIVMPGGMNGHELALAARERRPDLRMLYTSGYTKNAIVHQGRLDPGVELLSKPYRSQDLAQKLHSVLADSTEQSRIRKRPHFHPQESCNNCGDTCPAHFCTYLERFRRSGPKDGESRASYRCRR